VVVGANPPDPTAGRDVVVALDGRGDAEPLLDVAGAWAGILDAPLRIVTVFEPAPADVRQASHYTRHHGPPGDPFDYLARWKDRVLPSTETDVAIAAIADPISPAAGLAEHLRAYPAFLLAVGRGHSVATELGGGVVRNLLRTVPVPLLVVPGVRPEVRAEAVALPGTTQEA
jgi:nucleotide-binding universal stress UspA family protein